MSAQEYWSDRSAVDLPVMRLATSIFIVDRHGEVVTASDVSDMFMVNRLTYEKARGTADKWMRRQVSKGALIPQPGGDVGEYVVSSSIGTGSGLHAWFNPLSDEQYNLVADAAEAAVDDLSDDDADFPHALRKVIRDNRKVPFRAEVIDVVDSCVNERTIADGVPLPEEPEEPKLPPDYLSPTYVPHSPVDFVLWKVSQHAGVNAIPPTIRNPVRVSHEDSTDPAAEVTESESSEGVGNTESDGRDDGTSAEESSLFGTEELRQGSGRTGSSSRHREPDRVAEAAPGQESGVGIEEQPGEEKLDPSLRADSPDDFHARILAYSKEHGICFGPRGFEREPHRSFFLSTAGLPSLDESCLFTAVKMMTVYSAGPVSGANRSAVEALRDCGLVSMNAGRWQRL